MVLLAEIVLITGFLFLFFFAVTNIQEKEKRAFFISNFFALFFILIFLIILLTNNLLIQKFLSYIILILSLLILILFFIPFERNKDIKLNSFRLEKVDERDVIFSRNDLEPGSENYKRYYNEHPELKKIDERIRKLPALFEPGGILYSPLESKLAHSEFDFLESQLRLVDGEINNEKVEIDAEKITAWIKKITLYLGAKLVGICKPNETFYYSHVGRGCEPYGKKILLNHTYAVVFAVEMSFEQILRAPFLSTAIETGKQYVEAAKISIILANFIRSLGYSARAHIAGSNYQAILPPIAYQAGLGELGRIGILITPQYGPRVRLGLVTTDLPLVSDKPKIFGVQNFCKKCLKCAINCPSQAIEYGEKKEIRGVEKWPLNAEKCYQFWKKMGTDCAICVKVCPYSRPYNIFHNIIRAGIKFSPFFRNISIKADSLFYGKKIARNW